MSDGEALAARVRRLANRESKTRTEADVQADISSLLTLGGIDLDDEQVVKLEVPLGDSTRRRIDIEVGNAVIEVKRDLRRAGVLGDAVTQLAGYVKAQTSKLGARYVGVLSDGAEWRLYHLTDGELVGVDRHDVSPAEPDVEALTVWLEGILATRVEVEPIPDEIERRLGAQSPAHRLDHATLRALFDAAAEIPEVAVKRELWAKLLRTAFGSAFTDEPRLFVDHTLLVLTAEIIAHAVVGFDVAGSELSAATLARGEAFAGSQIYGVVDADFFDWVLLVPDGPAFVKTLARNLHRFRWEAVEHDVLKVLYESVIDQQTRKSLGEYYTPDWLADRMVADTVTDPWQQRVLDPACGSGTFLFHAIRAFLAAADARGATTGEALQHLPDRVLGVDLHPVSVTLARVTYLLAIGNTRLRSPDRGPLTVPVYLGDAIQWDQHTGMLNQGEVRVETGGTDLAEGQASMLYTDDLVFPERVIGDVATFDRLVIALADRASTYTAGGKYPSITALLNSYGVHPDDRDVLTATFRSMCDLHADQRDHIWSYYVRNLIRPLWLSQTENKVDVLLGNPPWLAYRYMTGAMQERFTALSKARRLLTGRLAVSARDLSALFVARTVELYLRPQGRFGFVMPRAVLSRQQYAGFRDAAWTPRTASGLDVSFDIAWDLDQVRPHIFPVPAAVVRATYSPGKSTPLTGVVDSWTGKLPAGNIDWSTAEPLLSRAPGSVRQVDPSETTSPYKSRFRQGAVLAPRVLLFAEDAPASPLGAGAGRQEVRSRRSTQEKKPWKTVPGLTGTVEAQFLRPVHLGETVLPYRTLPPLQAVLPMSSSAILTVDQIDEYPGLTQWWSQAEKAWADHKVGSDSSDLLDRIDFHGQLVSQAAGPAHRVVYSASGNRLAAARVSDPRVIIEHKLYWAAASTLDEARYLEALLNSAAVQRAVAELQSRGQFGARDFDKYVWNAPIPTYDHNRPSHQDLAGLAATAEERAAASDLSHTKTFQKARGAIRADLAQDGLGAEIDDLTDTILSGG